MKSLNALEFLETHRRGEILEALDDAIKIVVEDVEMYDGKGEVTLKIGVKLDKGGVLAVTPAVSHKSPSRPLTPGMYWGAKGRLSRHDPRQMDAFEPDPEDAGGQTPAGKS